MKKNKRLFCDLMATEMYEDYHAVETVWGDKYVDSQEKADALMADDKVIAMIAKVKKAHSTRGTISKTWIKNTLVGLVDIAQSIGASEFYDPNTIRYALDMLNKMEGNYEKDNQQRADVSLTMQF